MGSLLDSQVHSLIRNSIHMSEACLQTWSLVHNSICSSVRSPILELNLLHFRTTTNQFWNHLRRCGEGVASFPGFPLTLTKNKNGGGEPCIDSYVISRLCIDQCSPFFATFRFCVLYQMQTNQEQKWGRPGNEATQIALLFMWLLIVIWKHYAYKYLIS